jgi:hypothetical protein
MERSNVRNNRSVVARPLTMRGAGLLVAMTLAACSGQSVRPIPPAYAEHVESARESLEENWDGLPKPRFEFVAMRCRADGGLVVIFAQLGSRDDGSFASAHRGTDGYGWAGGFGLATPNDNLELDFFFEIAPEVPCPAEPSA